MSTLRHHIQQANAELVNDFYSHEIKQSLRIAGNGYLSRTPSVSSSRTTYTLSKWIKHSDLAKDFTLLRSIVDVNDNSDIRFYSDNKFLAKEEIGNVNYQLYSTRVFRDPSAFYHVHYVFDSTNPVESERMRVWINGKRLTEFDTAIYPPLNAQSSIGQSGVLHTIGHNQNTLYADGYLTEDHLIFDQALGPEHFGELKNGVWIPKAFTGSYGPLDSFMDFSDPANIGKDSSGNGNDWTVTNLASYDVVPDNPTNNFCTLNPLYVTAANGFQNGNLLLNSSATGTVFSTFGIPEVNNFYYETYYSTVGSTYLAGVGNPITGSWWATYRQNGDLVLDGVTVGTVAAWASGDVIGVHINTGEDSISFYKNGDYVGVIENANLYEKSPIVYASTVADPSINFGQDSTFAGLTTAGSHTDSNGIGSFKYPVPNGALALCSKNLPESVFSSAGDVLCEDNFDVILWDGDDVDGRALIELTFKPGVTLAKVRTDVLAYQFLDAVRGDNAVLRANQAATELDPRTGLSGGGLSSFVQGGFKLTAGNVDMNNINDIGDAYVAWNWKMGDATEINNDGSIQSTVSANVVAGQAVVAYKGDGLSPATVGHGLTKPIEFIINKSRSSSNDWPVYHKAVGATKFLELNTNIAPTTSINRWGNTEPDDKVFTVYAGGSSSTNVLNEDYISYCFHSVEGYSKFMSYIGNGLIDGPYIFLGFRARWLAIKRADSTGSWKVYDTERSPSNIVDLNLTLNDSAVESVFDDIDILSNGIKIRTTNTTRNASGAEYIIAAFAEAPFKYANAA